MDVINGILNVLTPSNFFYCFAGCFLGTLVGVLPGLGPASALSILLPVTMYLDPTGSIIMLAGIYYGAQYGGSTTSILVNIPGEASTVATCFDGFPMTQQGRAGQALWIAAVGSFIAGTLGTIGMTFIGPGIAQYALQFGPAEYFGILVFSMTILISLSGTSLSKGLGAGMGGMILATVGVDVMTGTPRFYFSSTGLMRGLDLIPVVVGLFGIGEIMFSAGEGISKIYEGKLGRMMPRGNELKKGIAASIRGTVVGFPLGMLPGMIPALSSFLAYDLEKRISKYPEMFGKGVIEGVAAPEAANNASAQAGFIPLMTFGIPTSATLAILLGALMMYGLVPSPSIYELQKEFIWTIIGSMYIGNVILLVLNLPLVGLWARISLIPYKYLAPTILAICVVGAYSPRNTLFDVGVAIACGVLGFTMKKNDWPIAPLILGFILGPMLEQSLRQSLSIGGPMVLINRPIPVAFYLLTIVVTFLLLRYLRRVSKVVEKGTVL